MRELIGIVLTATVLFSPMAAAQTQFQDPATGFGMRTKPPFTVEPTSRRQFDVGAGVKSSTNDPPVAGTGAYICEGGFKAASQNNGLSRSDINALIAKPEWRRLARSAIEIAFTVSGEQVFTLSGYKGIEFMAQPNAGPGAENVRVLMSIVETAKGRVTLICLTDRRAFQRALPQFRSIRSMITLPM
jgi:hypothetical protein